MRKLALDREKALDKQKLAMRKAEEEFVRSKKEADKQAAKMKATNSAPGSQKEADLSSENSALLALVKCTTCKINMRGTVITKCMHTFCKECIETRIATRQRKCPACGIMFGVSDVQPLYLQ